MIEKKDKSSNSNQPDDFFRNINIQLLIHELKGPVDVIETNNRMLLENETSFGKLTDSQVRILKRTIRNTSRLRDMLLSLLEVGTSQNGRVDLHRFHILPWTREVARDALEVTLCEDIDQGRYMEDPDSCLGTYGLVIKCSPDVESALMLQDRTKYSNILGNLLRNALQYRQKLVQVKLDIEGEDLKVEVGDDGPGISEGERETLFTQYSGKKPENALRRKDHGMGLASSRILARLLGGDIQLSPNHKDKAHFIFTLPLQFSEESRQDTYVYNADS